jgi:hypothetical protein
MDTRCFERVASESVLVKQRQELKNKFFKEEQK